MKLLIEGYHYREEAIEGLGTLTEDWEKEWLGTPIYKTGAEMMEIMGG